MSHFRCGLLLAACLALPGAWLGPASWAQPAPQSAPTPAPQALPEVCLDAPSGSDPLIAAFANRLRETITASGTLSLASATDVCSLQLHVPGNLLRFQTAGAVMVSTVVIVTSPSGRYLSTSISACRATDLQPCAVRAVAAAKLAVLLAPNGGT